MKKFLCLLVGVVMSLGVTAGCANYNGGIPEAGTGTTLEEGLEKAAQETSGDTIGRKPTKYETVNNFKDVTMTVKNETVSSTGLTVTFRNHSSSQCTYGDYFCLEEKINGEWYEATVAIKGDYGFNSIGYDLASGDEGEREINWEWLYGKLDTGEYRIIKDILDFRGTGDYDTYYLAAEFTIS